MKHTFFTGIGSREQNEDVILIEEFNQENTLYLIVDGMGGYANGEVAAKLVAENVATYLRFATDLNSVEIQNAINKANLAIKQYNEANTITSGATLGGVLVSGYSAICFWLGDVKIYHLRNSKILNESQSHSLLNEMSDADFFNSAANIRRYNHIVTRSVSGKREKSQIDFFELTNLLPDDSLLICSDGVHNTMTMEHISLYLSQGAAISKIHEYLNIHAKDNFSLININL